MLIPLIALLPIFAALLVLCVLVKSAGGSHFKGWLGESIVNRMCVTQLDPEHYRTLGDIYLPRPDGMGTTQIDHIVISQFGIFVIETKNYKGWIFGHEKQPQWTQQIYKAKHRFQNPLHQNSLHVKALELFLDLPDHYFHSVVMFIGDCQFKTQLPGNVLSRGLLPWITNHTVALLDLATIQQANARLDELHRATDRKAAARDHVRSLKSRTSG